MITQDEMKRAADMCSKQRLNLIADTKRDHPYSHILITEYVGYPRFTAKDDKVEVDDCFDVRLINEPSKTGKYRKVEDKVWHRVLGFTNPQHPDYKATDVRQGSVES